MARITLLRFTYHLVNKKQRILLKHRKTSNPSISFIPFQEPVWYGTCLPGPQLKLYVQQRKDNVLSRDARFGRKGPEDGVTGLGFKFCFYHSLELDTLG